MKKTFIMFLILAMTVVLYAPASFADGEMVIEETPHAESWIEKHNITPVLETHITYNLQLKNCTLTNNTWCAANLQYDNSFDIPRFYFGLEGDITDHIGFNFTFDATTTVAGAGVFLKYGYLVFKDYDAAPGLSFIVGQQASPYVSHVEDVWGWRSLSQVFFHYEGYLNEADLGLTVKYMFPSEWGDLQFSLFNGNGFLAGVDNDNFKNMELKLTLKPFENKNFFGTLMGNFGFLSGTGNYFYRAGLLLGYKDVDKFTFAIEGLFASDQQAATIIGTQPSVGASPLAYGGALYSELKFYWWGDVGSKFSLVLRGDYLRSDNDTASTFHYRMMGGLAYTYNEYFKFIAAYDHSNYGAAALQDQGNNTALLIMEANL